MKKAIVLTAAMLASGCASNVPRPDNPLADAALTPLCMAVGTGIGAVLGALGDRPGEGAVAGGVLGLMICGDKNNTTASEGEGSD